MLGEKLLDQEVTPMRLEAKYDHVIRSTPSVYAYKYIYITLEYSGVLLTDHAFGLHAM